MPGIIPVRRVLLRGPPAAVVVPSAAMSLVLVGASTQYLSRTWGSAPTDGKKATISLFLKLASDPGNEVYFYSGGLTGGATYDYHSIQGAAGNNINTIYAIIAGATYQVQTQSPSVITDTTTWHHICIAFDSTQATEADRKRIYLDGVEATYSGTRDNPPQNSDWFLTSNGIEALIGQVFFGGAGATFDGKLAYYYLIDGQALTPSSFTTGTGAGTTSPAAYGGTFGANGFFLNFNNDTNDQSGNGNNWTQNNSPTFSSDVPT